MSIYHRHYLCRFTGSPVGWIFVIACISLWMTGCENKEKPQSNHSRQVEPGDQEDAAPFFTDVSRRSGLSFQHQLGVLKKYHFPDIMVAGCGVIDFDRDGLLDLVLVNSGDIEDVFAGKSSQNQGNWNRLVRQTETGSFVDVTEQVKLSDHGYGCGIAVADVNNDGFDDIYFANFGPDRLFVNVEGKSFEDITLESGIQNPSWSSSATFIDFDLDGRLDLFVTNYVSYIAETNCANAGDPEDFCNPRVFKRTTDKLFRNISEQDRILFEDVTIEMGIAEKSGPGLGVISRDFNQDGYPDIYVANDGWDNFLWVNQQGKKFSEQGGQLGCAMGLQGDAQAGMGVASDDLDHNGTLDIVVTHLDGETNAAYLGSLSDGKALFFAESGAVQGVQKISKPMTGFGIGLPDLDNDGDKDMITANGRVTRKNRFPGKKFWDDYAERNQISLNDGKGKFIEYLSANDPFLGSISVSRGLAILDVDNDGQQDCLVTTAASQPRLYRNTYGNPGNWVGFQVVDPALGGRNVLGAIVEITTGTQETYRATVQSDGSYQSAGDPRVHFGLGDQTRVMAGLVYWPGGTREQFQVEKVNQYYLLEKGKGKKISSN